MISSRRLPHLLCSAVAVLVALSACTSSATGAPAGLPAAAPSTQAQTPGLGPGTVYAYTQQRPDGNRYVNGQTNLAGAADSKGGLCLAVGRDDGALRVWPSP